MLQLHLVLTPFFHVVLHDYLLDVSGDHWLVLLAESDVGTDEGRFILYLFGFRRVLVFVNIANVIGHERVLGLIRLIKQ